MNDAVNLHATCIAIKHNGILLLGKSGAGKSDLALRLIENKNAILVADDRVDIKKIDDKIFASSPHTIKGLLEVRGVGIIKVPCLEQCDIKLAVNLVCIAQRLVETGKKRAKRTENTLSHLTKAAKTGIIMAI